MAACAANSPSRSISAMPKRVPSGGSSTERTPSAVSSCRSGTAIIAFGHVARLLGRVAREPWVVGEVVDRERLPRDEHPAGDARARRQPHADELAFAFSRDGLEDELLGLLVEQEDRRRLGAEDRARDVHDRLEQRPVLLLAAERSGRDGGAERALVHQCPPVFEAVR